MWPGLESQLTPFVLILVLSLSVFLQALNLVFFLFAETSISKSKSIRKPRATGFVSYKTVKCYPSLHIYSFGFIQGCVTGLSKSNQCYAKAQAYLQVVFLSAIP